VSKKIILSEKLNFEFAKLIFAHVENTRRENRKVDYDFFGDFFGGVSVNGGDGSRLQFGLRSFNN